MQSLHSISDVLRLRETEGIPASSLHGHLGFVRRMRITDKLTGHMGCVNRLSFSSDGNLLLSGSDDLTLRVWDVAERKCRAVVQTGHLNNIFGVRFLPHSNNEWLASGAMDGQVRVTHVNETTYKDWDCHKAYVKTVEVDHNDRNVVISASEDATVREFDVREPRLRTPGDPGSSNVCIRVSEGGKLVGVKSALLSPLNSHHLIVAASDPYIRIYDRRLSSAHSSDSSSSVSSSTSALGGCVQKLCPSHLAKTAPEFGSVSSHGAFSYASHAAYSSDGRRAIASYYGEHVYVFDLERGPLSSMPEKPSLRIPSFSQRSCSRDSANELLDVACGSLLEDSWTHAIGKLNQLLNADSRCVAAYLFRAEALLRRKWIGDFRRALADIDMLRDLVARNSSWVDELRKGAPIPNKLYSPVLEMLRIRAILGVTLPRAGLLPPHRLKDRECRRIYSRLLFVWEAIDKHMKALQDLFGGGSMSSWAPYLQACIPCNQAAGPASREKDNLRYESKNALKVSRQIVETVVTHPQRVRARVERQMAKMRAQPSDKGGRGSIRRGWRTFSEEEEDSESDLDMPHTGEVASGEPKVATHDDAGGGPAANDSEGNPSKGQARERQGDLRSSGRRSSRARTRASRRTRVSWLRRRALLGDGGGEFPDYLEVLASEGPETTSRPGRVRSCEGAASASSAERASDPSQRAAHDAAAQDAAAEATGSDVGARSAADRGRDGRAQEVRDRGEEHEGAPEGRSPSNEAPVRNSGSASGVSDSTGKCDGESHGDGHDRGSDLGVDVRKRGRRESTTKRRRRASEVAGSEKPRQTREDLNWKDVQAAEDFFWGSSFDLGYVGCYVGHCNIATDIKEANFFGTLDQVILSGSDDQHLYFWDAKTGSLLSRLRGDGQIVNAVQGHPFRSLIASSGIDYPIKLWTPRSLNGRREADSVEHLEEQYLANYENAQAIAASNTWNLEIDPAWSRGPAEGDVRLFFGRTGVGVGEVTEMVECSIM